MVIDIKMNNSKRATSIVPVLQLQQGNPSSPPTKSWPACERCTFCRSTTTSPLLTEPPWMSNIMTNTIRGTQSNLLLIGGYINRAPRHSS